MYNRIANTRTIVALGVLTIVAPSCDLNDLDEIQNSSNQAVVRAQFFASRTNQVPVPGVRMVIESDDDSDRPYRGPDVIGVSGDDGVATALVFPGFEDERDQNNNTGGNEQPTGPEDPLDLPPPLFFGDVAVTLIYQGSIVSFISGGLTLGSGRLFDLGPIFLDELQVVVN